MASVLRLAEGFAALTIDYTVVVSLRDSESPFTAAHKVCLDEGLVSSSAIISANYVCWHYWFRSTRNDWSWVKGDPFFLSDESVSKFIGILTNSLSFAWRLNSWDSGCSCVDNVLVSVSVKNLTIGTAGSNDGYDGEVKKECYWVGQ